MLDGSIEVIYDVALVGVLQFGCNTEKEKCKHHCYTGPVIKETVQKTKHNRTVQHAKNSNSATGTLTHARMTVFLTVVNINMSAPPH